MDMRIQVPKCILTALNQLYDMERKLAKAGDAANITRNVNKIRGRGRGCSRHQWRGHGYTVGL